jgi:hypothetical protein
MGKDRTDQVYSESQFLDPCYRFIDIKSIFESSSPNVCSPVLRSLQREVILSDKFSTLSLGGQMKLIPILKFQLNSELARNFHYF